MNHGSDKNLARKTEKKNKSLGFIIVRVNTLDEIIEHTLKNVNETEVNITRKSSSSLSTWAGKSEPTAHVHLVIVQARGLIPSDPDEAINPFCKISLGKNLSRAKSPMDKMSLGQNPLNTNLSYPNPSI